jgi:hypothetical protein
VLSAPGSARVTFLVLLPSHPGLGGHELLCPQHAHVRTAGVRDGRRRDDDDLAHNGCVFPAVGGCSRRAVFGDEENGSGRWMLVVECGRHRVRARTWASLSCVDGSQVVGPCSCLVCWHLVTCSCLPPARSHLLLSCFILAQRFLC